jgi:uncharacterized membrane protein YeiH
MEQQAWIRVIVLALDLGGTFVFALSGAALGIRHRLDLFGVLVLSFVGATGGGITRDVLIGATPPAAIVDWRYLATSVAAGLLSFFLYSRREQYQLEVRLRHPIMVLDAAGLSLFAVAGALKALAFRLGPVEAVLIGGLTAVGGGVLRDLLVSEVPTVLHSELYAVAALLGATTVVIGRYFAWPSESTVIAGAIICFGVRVVAMRRGWQLPTADNVRR